MLKSDKLHDRLKLDSGLEVSSTYTAKHAKIQHDQLTTKSWLFLCNFAKQNKMGTYKGTKNMLKSCTEGLKGVKKTSLE